jgi:hypothetical protein
MHLYDLLWGRLPTCGRLAIGLPRAVRKIPCRQLSAFLFVKRAKSSPLEHRSSQRNRPHATLLPGSRFIERAVRAHVFHSTVKDIKTRNADTDPAELQALIDDAVGEVRAERAMCMMAQGGVAITGFPPRGHHPADLAATNPLVMWAYTDLSDKRWKFTKKYLMLHQDPNNTEARKIGLFNPNTWVAYVLNAEAFVKQTQADPARTYPDFGCAFETFTNNDFLEIETLSPLTKVLPDQAAEHVEHWSLHRGVQLQDFTDVELDRVVLPLFPPSPAGRQ